MSNSHVIACVAIITTRLFGDPSARQASLGYTACVVYLHSSCLFKGVDMAAAAGEETINGSNSSWLNASSHEIPDDDSLIWEGYLFPHVLSC
jgi:hypothetical protein